MHDDQLVFPTKRNVVCGCIAPRNRFAGFLVRFQDGSDRFFGVASTPNCIPLMAPLVSLVRPVSLVQSQRFTALSQILDLAQHQ